MNLFVLTIVLSSFLFLSVATNVIIGMIYYHRKARKQDRNIFLNSIKDSVKKFHKDVESGFKITEKTAVNDIKNLMSLVESILLKKEHVKVLFSKKEIKKLEGTLVKLETKRLVYAKNLKGKIERIVDDRVFGLAELKEIINNDLRKLEKILRSSGS